MKRESASPPLRDLLPPMRAVDRAPVRAAPPDWRRASAIYEGWVRHRRHAPHAHEFRYRMFQLYLDLDELDDVFDGRLFWSVGRRNLAEFRRSDHLGDPREPLADAVRDRVEAAIGARPNGPIRLLTHLRYFGYVFNPVSFYYCYAEDGETLVAIVADITNTPWRERHAYVLPVAAAERVRSTMLWQFPKAFHVSPFMAMRHDYVWRFSRPGDNLCVQMDVLDPGADIASPIEAARTRPRRFDATLVLERKPLDGATLASALARYPFMTAKVVAAIHWQALRLWWRGNPVHDHPKHQEARPS